MVYVKLPSWYWCLSWVTLRIMQPENIFVIMHILLKTRPAKSPSHTHNTHAYTRANTHAHTHTHTHACTHAHTHAHTHTHIHACTHAHTQTHKHSHTHTREDMSSIEHKILNITRTYSNKHLGGLGDRRCTYTHPHSFPRTHPQHTQGIFHHIHLLEGHTNAHMFRLFDTFNKSCLYCISHAYTQWTHTHLQTCLSTQQLRT